MTLVAICAIDFLQDWLQEEPVRKERQKRKKWLNRDYIHSRASFQRIFILQLVATKFDYPEKKEFCTQNFQHFRS